MLHVYLVALFLYGVKCEISATVVTSRGPVVGQRSADGNYSTFLGIPFAMVDESNPFGSSQPYPEFDINQPYIANNTSVYCPQISQGNYIGQIDCLRLNIYVPNVASTSNLLPIFVFFHGGGLTQGSGSLYGGKYLVKHDIIVVTANSRLGPYGYLCLDDKNVPGNQGFKDQIAALRWIRDNIGQFGGNAEEVTIAGCGVIERPIR